MVAVGSGRESEMVRDDAHAAARTYRRRGLKAAEQVSAAATTAAAAAALLRLPLPTAGGVTSRRREQPTATRRLGRPSRSSARGRAATGRGLLSEVDLNLLSLVRQRRQYRQW